MILLTLIFNLRRSKTKINRQEKFIITADEYLKTNEWNRRGAFHVVKMTNLPYYTSEIGFGQNLLCFVSHEHFIKLWDCSQCLLNSFMSFIGYFFRQCSAPGRIFGDGHGFGGLQYSNFILPLPAISVPIVSAAFLSFNTSFLNFWIRLRW